ncbi:hypothetical protein L7F22_028646 [Adiantum nelumboides]|nr:hypothetical protein [Adiantum nelumboides]
MDYSCARGLTPLLDVQPPPHQHQRAEQPLPDYSLHHHQQTDQHRLHESCHMDYTDEHHQYKHHHHHHHHHHQRIQQFPLQHHHSPVVGGYIDLGGGCITAEASPCDSLPQIEREKHGLPQNQYANQYSSAIVQTSYRPYEDGFVSVKTHEEAHFPPKACEDAYVHPGRHENLHFAHDGQYSQHRLHTSPSASALIVPRIRFLCSIGGRIIGRPFDGKVRYCGGDTRVITVERGICFSEFIGKLSRMYGSGFTLKYQLPGEDLDALVSVTSDDDLQNMLDEYDKMLSSEASSWFRLFIFRGPFDWEIYPHHEFGHGRESCTQMLQRYINAINGFGIKGGSECPFTIHVDNISSELQSSSRMASDFAYTTLSFPCFPPKAFSRYASAPSSIPSSPSVAARLAHCKQCGNGDACFQMSKDQPGYVPPMNDIDVNSQEMSQDCHVESLKRDHHQSHIAGESPRIHQDPSFSRVDSPWMKENGVSFVDTEDTRLHQHERHRSTATLLVDSLHDVSKPLESRCETNFRYCPGTQPLTSPICHGGQVEDDFGRFEPMQHSYMEGHKQAPLGHQLQSEGLAQVRRGPGIGPTCQTIDGHGYSQFFQEPVHVHLPHVNVRSLIPSKALGLAPSSPQNVHNQRCCCCQQHFQVDRGISVSLGENSHSKKPSYLGDRISKQHVLSRFCDDTNFCSDSAALHCLPRLETGLDFDEDELSKKHTLCKINTRHLVDYGAKENVAHSLMEPVHVLHEGNQCLSCYADSHYVKGQHLDKARDHSNSEFQNYAGHFDIHPGKSEDHLTAGRPILDVKADINLDRGNDTVTGLDYSNGHGDLETRTSCMIDGREAAGYVHIQASNDSSVLGQRKFDCGLKSESFSSTAAEAGSLSRHSLEHPGWVDSPPVVYHDQLKVREFQDCIPPVDLMASTRQMVDGSVDHGNAGDTCRRPSFDCLDPYARLRLSCTPANATELRVEDSPVSSLTHVQEDKSSISNARKSTPNFDNGRSVSSSQPFALRTLDLDSFRGSATLALPMYDQSPISSVNNATFSFSARPSELKNVSLEKEASEQCFKNRSALISAPLQSYGQHQEIAKPEADSASQKTTEQEIAPVLEDSRALSRHSSRPCSTDSGVHEKRNAPSETVSIAQNRGTSGSAQEVGGLDGCFCP